MRDFQFPVSCPERVFFELKSSLKETHGDGEGKNETLTDGCMFRPSKRKTREDFDSVVAQEGSKRIFRRTMDIQ